MNSSDLAMSLLEQRVPLALLIDLALGVDSTELMLEAPATRRELVEVPA